jgi:transcription elongation GreA/GreB family factor
MSRAFVSEEAAEAAAAQVPERPVSTAPNLVTPSGLRHIDAEVARLEAALAAAEAEDPEHARLARDLRYWRARHTTAQLVPAAEGEPREVAFGTRVTLRRDGGSVVYRIVGEDEADPPQGLLAYTSPLAVALTGATVGEVVEIGGGRPAVTVERIAAE